MVDCCFLCGVTIDSEVRIQSNLKKTEEWSGLRTLKMLDGFQSRFRGFEDPDFGVT